MLYLPVVDFIGFVLEIKFIAKTSKLSMWRHVFFWMCNKLTKLDHVLIKAIKNFVFETCVLETSN